MLQHTLADELRTQKLDALTAAQPDVIATANVGCQLHLRDGTDGSRATLARTARIT